MKRSTDVDFLSVARLVATAEPPGVIPCPTR